MQNYLSHKTNKEIKNTRCVYCKKDITTASDIPICSRKACKKLHPRSMDGMYRIILYSEKMIEVQT